MVDDFSTDWVGERDGFGVTQAHSVYYAAGDVTGGGAQVVMTVTGISGKYR